MEPEESLLYSQESTRSPCLEPDEFTPRFRTILIQDPV
jgi:hypothetical protein